MPDKRRESETADVQRREANLQYLLLLVGQTIDCVSPEVLDEPEENGMKNFDGSVFVRIEVYIKPSAFDLANKSTVK